VIDSLPSEHRQVFVEVLAALRSSRTLTQDDIQEVESAFYRARLDHLGPDKEPTERGAAIGRALRAFLARWPSDI
jgi:hypothetical protein